MLEKLTKDLLVFLGFVDKEVPNYLFYEGNESTRLKTLRVVAYSVLDWLKVEAIRRRSKPLYLEKDYDWCNEMIRLIEEVPEFSNALVVTEKGMTYNPTITEEEKQRVFELVKEYYKPVVRKTPKRSS